MFSCLKSLLLRFGIILILVGLTSTAGAADIATIVKKNDSDVTISDRFLVLEDAHATLTPAQVLTKRSEFKSIDSSELTKGYTSSAFWVLFSVENQSTDEVIPLASTYPVLDIDAFRIVDASEGRVEHVQRFDRRIPSVALDVKRGSTETFLMKVTSSQFLVLKFYLTTVRGLDAEENSSNMFYALIFGCFLTAFMSNFALFLILRYRSYLYYLLFSFVNCHLTFLAIKFPAGILHWGDLYWYELAHPYSTLGAFTTFLFVRNFLQTKEEFPTLDKAMRLFMAGLVVIAALELYKYSPAYPNFADMYYQIGVVLLIIAGVKSVRSGFAPSKYYLVSLFCFLAGIATYLTLTLGYLPSNMFTLNALVIGQTAEMLLMSLALSSKLKLIERESHRSAMKTQLLKTITHDIGNPLSIIKISSQYFQSLGQSRSLAQIDRATGIIENLIHYVHERRVSDRVDIGKLTNVSLNEVFEDVAFAYGLRAEAKQIRLDFQKSDPDIFVWAQKSTLAQQIMGNLISNAIKFSPSGSTIRIRSYTTKNNKVIIEIKDEGEGIRPAMVAKLNRSHDRNESTLGTNGETGFGYGISIVKDTLRVARGNLEISSIQKSDDQKAYGTTVRISLSQGDFRRFRFAFNFKSILVVGKPEASNS